MDMSVETASTALIEPARGVIKPSELMRVARRNTWLVIPLMLIGAAGAYIYAASLPKSYTSSASIAVQGDRYSIPELQGAVQGANSPDPLPWVRTEMQALSSRALIQKVVNQLNLAGDPEFNPTLRPPTIGARIKNLIQSLLPHKAGLTSTDTNDAVLLAATHALSTFQDDRDLVIDVSFTAHDPNLAARFVNTLISDYLAARTTWRNAANQGASADMTQRIAQARSDLDNIEKKMRDLRSQSGVVGLMRSGTVGQQQLEELATAADRATLDRIQLEANWQHASDLIRKGDTADLASVLGSDTISRLRDQESIATSRLAEMSAAHGANYPGMHTARSQVAAVRGQIADEAKRIVDSLQTQVQVARAHEAEVKSELAQARDAAVKAQNTEAQLSQLQADANSERQVYQMLLERAQQANVQTTKSPSDIPDVRVLSSAVPSGFPSAPNMKMATALGLAGGGLLGALFAFLREERRDGFGDPGTLNRAAGLAVAATLPRRSLRRRGSLLVRITPGQVGPEIEAFRLLRARLRAAARGGLTLNVAFIGAATNNAGEIAAAFARSAAIDGEHVLLMEGDLEHPGLGPLLGLKDNPLEEALRGTDDWRDVIASDADAPLDILVTGSPVTDGQALLAGTGLQNLLMEARDHYKLVVIGAPLITDPGTRTLAQRVDSLVLVVDGRRARREAVKQQVTELSALSRVPMLALLVLPT